MGGGCPGPRQEFVDAVDLVVGDAGQHVTQVGEQLDAVQLARLDQAVDDSGALAATLYCVLKLSEAATLFGTVRGARYPALRSRQAASGTSDTSAAIDRYPVPCCSCL